MTERPHADLPAAIPAVLAALTEHLPDVIVGTALPADHSAPDFAMVRIVDAGGPELEDGVIDWCDITWEAWAAGDSSARAETLAAKVRKSFYAMSGPYGDGYIIEGRSTRPRDFPDETTNIPRYVGQARVLFHAS